MSAVAASASASAAPPEAASSSSSAIVAPAAPVRPAYFERQSLSRCALHALNNLLQSAAFSVADLNAICEQLTPGKGFRNPHKSMIGLGNWDVNVIMRALQTKDLQVSWFDRRKGQIEARARGLQWGTSGLRVSTHRPLYDSASALQI